MAIAFAGATTTTKATLDAATSITVDLPTDIQAGDLLTVVMMSGGSLGTVAATGWSVNEQNPAGVDDCYLTAWKVATGAEGATQVFTKDAVTRIVGAVAFRVTGVDTTTPFNTAGAAEGYVATTSTPSVAANTITGITSGSVCLFCFGDMTASRTITSQDADLTLIISNTSNNYTLHSLYEASPGSGNAQYDFTMNDTRDYSWMLMEVYSATTPAGQLVTTKYNDIAS